MSTEQQKRIYSRRSALETGLAGTILGASALGKYIAGEKISATVNEYKKYAQLLGLDIPAINTNIGSVEINTPEIDFPEPPKPTFKGAKSCLTVLDITRDVENIKIGAGDSEMLLGLKDYGAPSPLGFFVDDMTGKDLGYWRGENLAFESATPAQVLEQTIKTQKFVQILNRHGSKHLWLDLGGANLKNLGQTQSEADNLKLIAKAHIVGPQDIFFYKDIVTDIENQAYYNLSKFKSEYDDLMGYIITNFGGEIENITMNSTPQFSSAEFINLGKIGTDNETIPLTSIFVKRVVNVASILINNIIAEVADKWLTKSPHVRISFVDASGINSFEDGIHLSKSGSQELAMLAGQKYKGYSLALT